MTAINKKIVMGFERFFKLLISIYNLFNNNLGFSIIINNPY